jgi:hypothetical protein
MTGAGLIELLGFTELYPTSPMSWSMAVGRSLFGPWTTQIALPQSRAPSQARSPTLPRAVTVLRPVHDLAIGCRP